VKRNSKIILGIVVLIIALVGGYYAMSQTPSIEHLKQHPEKFRFEDYGSKEGRYDVLSKLFPVGTPKKDVDDFLVEAVGLESGTQEKIRDGAYTVNYHHPDFIKDPAYQNHNVLVKYDASKDTLLLLQVYDRDFKMGNWYPNLMKAKLKPVSK
jgi:hypothetical protein